MKRGQRGYQLGNTALWVDQDFLFHVITQDKPTRDAIVDAITGQKDKTLVLYDPDARRTAGNYPLDWKGSVVANASRYPSLLLPPPDGYLWQTCYFSGMSGSDVSSVAPLSRGTVRATVTVLRP